MTNSFITLSDKTELPYYVIEDIIEKDIKNIMVAVLLKQMMILMFVISNYKGKANYHKKKLSIML